MSGSTAGELALLVGGELAGEAGVMVTDVVHDSRTAGPGTLFVAIEGAQSDGHEFVAQAMARGSEVVCVTHQMEIGATQLIVENTRQVMGLLAASVHGDPSGSVPVIGVTGTNGKTTVTHFIESIGSQAGLSVGLVGTISTRVGEMDLSGSGRTTPEATDFQRLLATMRDSGAEMIATEVSSHALELDRVRGTRFAVAAFTNLSQDHLDFHGDMSSYRRAKESLFKDYPVGTAVIDIDDPVGAEITTWAGMPKLTVGAEGNYFAEDVEPGNGETTFLFSARGKATRVTAPVVGTFNVQNLIMAAVCCLALGLEESAVVDAMRRVSGVPGRFELVSGDSPVAVVVDYAHTPEGIVRAIEVGRRTTTGRVIAVIGAGGDRDRAKRPLMGKAAAAADLVIVTSDNPRSEDPGEIAAAVASGLPTPSEAVVELDRRAAITMAIGSALDGDLVLVLGKGHERTQETGGEVVPFDDAVVTREVLGARRYPAAGPDSGSMEP